MRGKNTTLGSGKRGMMSGSFMASGCSLPGAEARRSEPEATDARSGPDAVDPRLHGAQPGLELDPQPAEHHDARCEGRIGKRELASDQELLPGEVIAQVVEAAAQLLARLLDTLRIALRVRLAELSEQH